MLMGALWTYLFWSHTATCLYIIPCSLYHIKCGLKAQWIRKTTLTFSSVSALLPPCTANEASADPLDPVSTSAAGLQSRLPIACSGTRSADRCLESALQSQAPWGFCGLSMQIICSAEPARESRNYIGHHALLPPTCYPLSKVNQVKQMLVKL